MSADPEHTNVSVIPSAANQVTLDNGSIQVSILPGKGCDIFRLRDVATGVDVLAKTRLTPADLQSPGYVANSAEAWLAQYPGGWQLVLPNGGAAADVDGAQWGFHGEACLLRWAVESLSATSLSASVRLLRAPLLVRRQFEIADRTLTLRETVRNESVRDIELMWAHHPAFGAPFLDAGCLVSTGARTLTADDDAPGTVLGAGSVHSWPAASAPDGTPVSLDRVPGPGSGTAHLAYLSDFVSGYFGITNPRLGLGIAFRWPLETFPCAWYWLEAGASTGFPWYGGHYTLAIEPATSAPAQGMAALAAKGGTPLRLAPGEERSVDIEATLFKDRRRVWGVGPAGDVTFETGRKL